MEDFKNENNNDDINRVSSTSETNEPNFQLINNSVEKQKEEPVQESTTVNNSDVINQENVQEITEDQGNAGYRDSFKDNSSYNFGSNNVNSDVRYAPYYTENHKKKTRKKNFTIVQLIAVALSSAILGGGVVGTAFMFASPIIQPAVSKLTGSSLSSTSVGNNGIYKKVEIESSTSPVSAVAEKVGPSIVGISVTAKTNSSIFNIGGSTGTSEGSGIIIRSEGYILTNYHVIQSAAEAKQGGAAIQVILPSAKDKPYTAQIVGTDWRTDLAVLKIDAKDLPAVEFGDSDSLKVGELAIAIGNPAGMELFGSVTTGIISGLDRTIPLEDIQNLKLIQTDASINPGNSGGALVNSEGKVIGINNAKLGGEGYEGLGFAIPSNTAKEITDNLIAFKYVKGRPLLGISVDSRFTEAYAKQYNVPAGVLVADVNPLSGAYKAGIQIGDIITKADGTAVKSQADLDNIKNKKKPGDTMAVEIYRDGKTKNLQVVLSEDTGNK